MPKQCAGLECDHCIQPCAAIPVGAFVPTFLLANFSRCHFFVRRFRDTCERFDSLVTNLYQPKKRDNLSPEGRLALEVATPSRLRKKGRRDLDSSGLRGFVIGEGFLAASAGVPRIHFRSCEQTANLAYVA